MPDVDAVVAAVRKDVAALHAELVRHGLVVWTGGDVSARVPGADLFVIKPSGVPYEALAPENMILCDLDGSVVPGSGAVSATRRATPRRTLTSTGTCPRWAASFTRTRRTPWRGRRVGAGLPGGASLMEDYTYDLVPGEERILGAHMLEVAPSLTTAKPRLEVHTLGIGGKDDPVRLVFTADPGPALVVAMSDMRDRFRLVANVVEIVDAPALPRLPVGRAVWKPRPDFATSAACWLTAGAAHHTVMTTAVGIDVFRDFADITRTELLTIDETTSLREFQKELRWNQAYYRLALGL